MRIMGLDVGSKTVGVAVSDPLGFTAQGLEIIQIDEDKKEFGLERLAELVAQYKVDRFVVGFCRLNKLLNQRANRATKKYKNTVFLHQIQAEIFIKNLIAVDVISHQLLPLVRNAVARRMRQIAAVNKQNIH